VPYEVLADGAEGDALTERARNIEDICILLWDAVTRQRLLPGHTIWLADHLGVPLAVSAIARQAAAVLVASSAAPQGGASLVARAGAVPVIAGVTGLFACASAGDLVIVAGEHGGAADSSGEILVNPPASMVAKVRNQRGRTP
jgi:signal transduction protein with GAF and PtsI domain